MRIPPTAVLLTWPQPNYTNPHTQGQALVITNAVLMALITIAVALRFYSRWRSHRRLGLDDYLIGIALIFSLGLGAAVILANVKYAWNRHIWDVPLSKFQGASLMAFVAKLLFTIAATFTRLSLISFYFRLVKDSGYNRFRMVLWAGMFWQIAVCITFTLLIIFLCNPVDSYWNLSKVYDSKCLDEGTVTLVAGVINCVSDLMLTVLPIPIIWRLNMPLRQRLGVVVLLSVGFLVTIAGIIRTFYIWKALVDTYDETWYSYPLWICAAAEIDLAVLCACVPALKPIFHPMVKKAFFMASSSPYSSTPDSPAHGRPKFSLPRDSPQESSLKSCDENDLTTFEETLKYGRWSILSSQRPKSQLVDARALNDAFAPSTNEANARARASSRSSSRAAILADRERSSSPKDPADEPHTAAASPFGWMSWIATPIVREDIEMAEKGGSCPIDRDDPANWTGYGPEYGYEYKTSGGKSLVQTGTSDGSPRGLMSPSEEWEQQVTFARSVSEKRIGVEKTVDISVAPAP